VSAALTVSDIPAAVSFYQKALGFSKRSVMNGPDGKPIHAELILQFQYTAPQYIFFGKMAHTIRDKKKLLNRVRRVRGQIEAVERLLENEKDCAEILQQIAACRGSINSLMSEVLEGHIRFHLVEREDGRKSHKGSAVEEVIGIAKSYLK
jgi:DNA-binding FrmR family transcriptional regulator